MKKIINNKYTLPILIGLAGILIGWWLKPSAAPVETGHTHESIYTNSAIGDAETVWTCSMHPQIRMNEAGQCSICGMDLIPLANSSSTQDPMAVEMSPDAMQLANVQTTVVGGENRSTTKEIRLNGKIQADERKVYVQSSHIPGRVEQLNVNFTGEPVSRGKVLAMVYSPELVTAQQELLEAQKIKTAQPELFNAAINKLKNWKLTEAQINRILENRKPIERFPILADVNGFALEKKVNLGDYVQRGSPIYEIADLSSVWVQFEAYESDLPWIKAGAEVAYTIASLPGETFTGKITFVDPVIDPKTRVALARVEVKNPEGKLKPGVFATGKISSSMRSDTKKQISVPKSAVMWTGKRSVVYVKTAEDKNVYFSLREVVLGTSLGDAYEVVAGLENGEEIVTNGTFTIDAAAQLAGKPSMMRPEGGTVMSGHNHGGMDMENTQPTASANAKTETLSKEAKAAVEKLVNQYLQLKNALVKDNFAEASKQAKSLKESVSKTNMSLFTGNSHNMWIAYEKRLQKQLELFIQTKKIESAREVFIELSNIMIEMTHDFSPFSQTFYIQYCSMANQNKGAEWLSVSKEIENPYYGASMLGCGEVTKTIQ